MVSVESFVYERSKLIKASMGSILLDSPGIAVILRQVNLQFLASVDVGKARIFKLGALRVDKLALKACSGFLHHRALVEFPTPP